MTELVLMISTGLIAEVAVFLIGWLFGGVGPKDYIKFFKDGGL